MEPSALAQREAKARRPRAFRPLLVLVAVVPLAVIVYLLAQGVMGKGAGSGSPEGAVRALVDASNRQDPTGAMAAIAPEEITSVRRLYQSAVRQAASSKVINSTGHPLDGLDVRLDGLTYNTTALGDGVARVNVTGGSVGYRIDPAKSSAFLKEIGAIPSRGAGSTAVSEIVSNIDRRNQDASHAVSGLYVVAVKRHGRWFVSPEYTLAEYLREAGGLALPSFTGRSNGTTGGAATPKEAVTTFADALSSVDVHRIINALPPDELGVLYDYEETLRTAMDQTSLGRRASDVTAHVNPPDVTESPLPDNRVRLDIDRLTGVITVNDRAGSSRQVDFTVSGSCATAQIRSRDSFGTDSRSSKGCVTNVSRGIHLDKFFVVVANDRGKWFVDPLATAAEYGRVAVESATPVDVECLLRRQAQRYADKTESVCNQSPMFASGA